MPAPFASVLFDTAAAAAAPVERAPAHFEDLCLDQVVAAITRGREPYDLAPFLATPLRAADAVTFRHEVFSDLEDPDLVESIQGFARQMRGVRDRLAQAGQLHHQRQQQRWLLDARALYCDAVRTLAADLARRQLRSRGLLAIREHLSTYTASADFTDLAAETVGLQQALAAITYGVTIRGARLTVSRIASEADYGAEIEATFERFRQRAAKDYRVRFPDDPGMDHVEAGILNLVARLYPDTFTALAQYCRRHQEYLDDTVGRFDREVQFYLAYLEYIAPLRQAGLPFCSPRVSARSKEVFATETFDVALARRLVGEGATVVCNDFALSGPERILVVSGPNQGGKTTLARTFGQLHHLASLGCPVPGRAAQLVLFDQLFTHFGRAADHSTPDGTLQDELVRVRDILAQATSRSLVVMNESLASTTLGDALALGAAVLGQMIERDLLGVWVTFVEELASLGPATVSMVSVVAPGDATARTYRVVRRPADGLAYALAIAKKYGLTYERLRSRLAP